MTIPLEEYEQFERMFGRGLRRLPKFRRLQDAVDRVDERYGEYGDAFIDTERLLRIYAKIHESQSVDALPNDELRYVGRLLFLGVDADHPPLIAEAAVRRSTLSRAASFAPGLKRTFLKSYCASESAATDRDARLLADLRTLAEDCPRGDVLLSGAWLQVGAIGSTARLLNARAPTGEAIAEMSGGWFRPDSPFCREAWRLRIGYRRRQIDQVKGDLDRLDPILDVTEADSLDRTGALIWGEFANEIADAVLGPYLDDRGYLPNEFEERRLSDFMLKLFGDPADPTARWQWAAIQAKFLELIEHWKKGRQIHSTLAFVRELTSSTGVSAKHWEERERYWKAYWRAGRVRGCRVFVKDRLRSDWIWSRARKFQNACDFKGVLTSSSSAIDQMVLMIMLDSDITVLEVNYVGKMRIGQTIQASRSGHRDVSASRSRLDYQMDVMNFGEPVIHNAGWQTRASQIIRRLSGRPIPAGANG